MIHRSTVASSCLIALAAALLPAAPLRADEAGDLQKKLLKAYADASSYRAEVVFSATTRAGRTWQKRSGEFTLALDRKGNRLRLEHPDLIVTCADKQLRLIPREGSTKYVEMKLDGPLSLGLLAARAGFVLEPVLPDLVLLLAANPLETLLEGPVAAAKALPAGPDKQVGLELAGAIGTWTLWLDPATHLVARATFAPAAAGNDAPPAPIHEYQVKVTGLNKPPEDASFAADTGKSEPVASMEALTGQKPHVLQGKKAPDFTLSTPQGTTVELAKETAEVVVLDFWATWCPPCRKGLPRLQAVADWAAAAKKPVKVYAVNVKEEADKAAAFFKAQGLTLPVLLDASGEVALSYGVEGIPQTVLIHRGKAVVVHVGLSPMMDEALKHEIEALLSSAAPKGDAPQE